MQILAAHRLRSFNVSANKPDLGDLNDILERNSKWKAYLDLNSYGGGKLVFQGVNVPGKKFEISMDSSGNLTAWSPLGVNLKAADTDPKSFFKKLNIEILDWILRKEKAARTAKGGYRQDLLEEAYQLEELEDTINNFYKKL